MFKKFISDHISVDATFFAMISLGQLFLAPVFILKYDLSADWSAMAVVYTMLMAMVFIASLKKLIKELIREVKRQDRIEEFERQELRNYSSTGYTHTN